MYILTFATSPDSTIRNTPSTKHLSMLESIYDDNLIYRVLYPGAPDTYRERVYSVDRWVIYMR